MRSKKTLFFMLLLVLFSCGQGESNLGPAAGGAVNEQSNLAQETENNDPPDDEAEGIFPNQDEVVFPAEFEIKTYYISIAGSYHNTDELTKIKQKKEWIGCYKNDVGEMELKAVKMTFKRVFDEMMDSDKKRPTGIEPVPSDAVDCAFVMNPIGGMKPKKIVSLLPEDSEFLPGEQKIIKSNDVVYRIYATGERIMENDQEGIRNYKLFITSKDKNGLEKTQLLMQVPTFGEYDLPSIRIALASYLDDDAIPDFILSNESQTLIYLSKFASENEIVHIVGSDVLYSGC
ncbi:MAG: hypothetical protein FGM14_13395 [Flavobacteriales bacterium]|nr:hypothetical protein [Flavobacteriales bacterium]